MQYCLSNSSVIRLSWHSNSIHPAFCLKYSSWVITIYSHFYFRISPLSVFFILCLQAHMLLWGGIAAVPDNQLSARFQPSKQEAALAALVAINVAFHTVFTELHVALVTWMLGWYRWVRIQHQITPSRYHHDSSHHYFHRFYTWTLIFHALNGMCVDQLLDGS